MAYISKRLFKASHAKIRERAKGLLNAAFEAGVATEKRDWPAAEKKWHTIVKEFGDDTPANIWVRLSISLRRQGRYARAEEAISKALRLFPKHIGIMNEFAEIAHARQDWDEAIQRWQKILYKWDKDQATTAYVRLPQAYSKIGKHAKAERLMREGLRLHPENLSLLEAHAQLAVEAEAWPEAVKRWQLIIDSYQDIAPASTWVGFIKSLRQLRDFERANEFAALGLERYPNDAWLRMEFAEIANDRKDWPEALKRWQSTYYDLGNQSSTPLWVKLHIRMNVSVLNRITNIKEYKSQIKRYRTVRKPRRIAVYTSLTKNYDLLKLPEIIDERFDYIAYSDDPIDGMGVFDVRKLNQPDFKTDSSRATRYPKTHPHVLLKSYEVAVWMDASMMIVGDLAPLVDEFIKSGRPIGNATHPHRQSLHEELEACIDLGKDDVEILKKQLQFYDSINFDTSDLANNGVMLFNLNHPKLNRVMENWWEQICRFSKRDQLSFNYALFKNKANRYKLTEPPADVRNYPAFVFVPHTTEPKILKNLYELL
ncbi:MAG: glycosyltransferase domain-containing protein [Candidatus Saccharimonadales bacterium]